MRNTNYEYIKSVVLYIYVEYPLANTDWRNQKVLSQRVMKSQRSYSEGIFVAVRHKVLAIRKDVIF
jgi:hypothetical protein